MWLNSHHPVAYSKKYIPPSSSNYQFERNPISIDIGKLIYVDSLTKIEKDEITQLLEQWNQSPQEVLKNLEDGVKSHLRPVIWQLVSRSVEMLDANENVYNDCVTQTSKHEQNILMDTERTLPFLPGFTTQNQTCANNVLIAYSNKDTVMGYSQGMNYVVATLIRIGIPEENAFWLLLRMMKGFSLERIYPSEYSVISECFVRYEKLLQIYVPSVYQHIIINLKVPSALYLQQWFQTIFLYTQRLDLTLRVLDLLVIRKIEALFCVSIAIISLSQDKILELQSMMDVIQFLKTLDDNILSTNSIIEKAKSYPNLLHQLQELEKQTEIMNDKSLDNNCILM